MGLALNTPPTFFCIFDVKIHAKKAEKACSISKLMQKKRKMQKKCKKGEGCVFRVRSVFDVGAVEGQPLAANHLALTLSRPFSGVGKKSQ